MDRCRKPPFPAMSGHFAHTLDDLRGNYLEIKTIEITEGEGVLSPDNLKILLASDANVIKYNNAIYQLTERYNGIRIYVSITHVEGTEDVAEERSITVNINSGEYYSLILRSKTEENIDQKIEEEISKAIEENLKSIQFVDTEDQLNELPEYDESVLYIVKENQSLYIFYKGELIKFEKLSLKMVSNLPEKGEENIIYLLMNNTSCWAQYIWYNESWKLIGTEFSEDYYTKEEINAKIEEATTRIATITKVGAIKSSEQAFDEEQNKAYIIVEEDGKAHINMKEVTIEADKIIESIEDENVIINGGDATI